MSATLVDSNILLDILTEDPQWQAWSANALEHSHGKAGFLAGKCFVSYRRRGGAGRTPLPDLYIGAHAAVARMRLLTRDASRYRSYFPSLEVVAPG